MSRLNIKARKVKTYRKDHVWHSGSFHGVAHANNVAFGHMLNRSALHFWALLEKADGCHILPSTNQVLATIESKSGDGWWVIWSLAKSPSQSSTKKLTFTFVSPTRSPHASDLMFVSHIFHLSSWSLSGFLNEQYVRIGFLWNSDEKGTARQQSNRWLQLTIWLN